MIISNNLHQAVTCLKRGQVIAYPTEAVYGLGCDPFNEKSVTHLLDLKKRTVAKGLILIASDWSQVAHLVRPVSPDQQLTINETWPGPNTWVFPASPETPAWLRGSHTTIAIRITNHPLAKALCDLYEKPIVSTSANLSGSPSARTMNEVLRYFENELDFLLQGEVGGLFMPTTIRDAVTGRVLR